MGAVIRCITERTQRGVFRFSNRPFPFLEAEFRVSLMRFGDSSRASSLLSTLLKTEEEAE